MLEVKIKVFRNFFWTPIQNPGSSSLTESVSVYSDDDNKGLLDIMKGNTFSIGVAGLQFLCVLLYLNIHSGIISITCYLTD